MLLFTFAAVASGARIQLSAEGSPTERVIKLIEDLLNQVQEEGKAEADTYDKFACFCKDKDGAKVESIATREADVETLTADPAQLAAEATQLKADIAQLTEDIGRFEAELAEMTRIRDEEHAVYETEHADATAAVNALRKAIEHIENSKSLATVKTDVQKAVAVADALGMNVDTSAVTELLQQPESMEVPEEDYTFHSGGIVDTLNELLKEFEDRKATLEKEEEAAQQSFDAAAKAKREELDAAKTTLETREEQLSENESTTAEKTEELTEQKALLHDDNAYLKDLTGQCEDKATSTGAGGRTAAEPASSEEAPPMEGSPSPDKLLMQVGDDSNDDSNEYHDVVFV